MYFDFFGMDKLLEQFDGKNVLIVGGTGSLGTALTKKLLESHVKTIRIFSREEWKQVQLQSQIKDSRLRFFIGDIRDKDRLRRALEDVDIVIHAAALKHITVAEYNPFEAVKTNVYGTQNLIDCCLDADVEKAIAIGTDKAVSPFNTYGATKFLMERLFVSANNFKGKHKTNFMCVRYGNVLGSRGSIVPIVVNQIKSKEKITVTDPTMTRFSITMDQALQLIFRSLQHGLGGEVFIPKIKAYRTGDIIDSLIELYEYDPDNLVSINVRSGEKYHESLISDDELRNAHETKDDYVLLEREMMTETQKLHLEKNTLSGKYSSDGVDLFTKDELKTILVKENLVVLK